MHVYNMCLCLAAAYVTDVGDHVLYGSDDVL